MVHLFLATPEKVVFDGEVVSLVAPGTVGYFEILKNHAPLVSTLKPGKLTVTDQNGNKIFWALSEGYFEIYKNKAILLADALEIPEEIDIKRAESAKSRAEERILSKDKSIDLIRTKKALQRAENRIKLFNEFKYHTVKKSYF